MTKCMQSKAVLRMHFTDKKYQAYCADKNVMTI